MINENEWIVVGLVTSPHGINGKVKVQSLSDFKERFINPGVRWIQKNKELPKALELISGYQQPGKKNFIVAFKGINNRSQAENLKNYRILVKTECIPKLKKDEFHLIELINLKVKIVENEKLRTIGKVINLENEQNNLLVVQLLKDEKKILIPFVKEIVPIVDIENEYLIINPPNGLLEL